MCRILGYFGNNKINEEVIRNAIAKQIHGGPDHQSFHTENGWALANNRLAIQGLDGGVQPFNLGKIHAVYNGEIYNHRDLKKKLTQKGYTINDQCDGSVILPLYELYGDDFVEYLDGMFAIAIVDERAEPKIMLATDSCAMKSIYYHFNEQDNTLFFASELAALFAFPIVKKIRSSAINEYLIGRSIWHNNTFFEGVYVLAPRTILTKTKNSRRISRIYQSKLSICSSRKGFNEAGKEFSNLLEHEVQQMLQADVPACLITSGGLDSSFITALAAKNKTGLECFNIAYEGSWPSDERHFAKEVADHCGVRYNQVLIQEFEFPDLLDKTIQHLGQPNSAPH